MALWLSRRALRRHRERLSGSSSAASEPKRNAVSSPQVVAAYVGQDEFWVCWSCRSLNRREAGKCYRCHTAMGSARPPAPASPPARRRVPVMAEGIARSPAGAGATPMGLAATARVVTGKQAMVAIDVATPRAIPRYSVPLSPAPQPKAVPVAAPVAVSPAVPVAAPVAVSPAVSVAAPVAVSPAVPVAAPVAVSPAVPVAAPVPVAPVVPREAVPVAVAAPVASPVPVAATPVASPVPVVAAPVASPVPVAATPVASPVPVAATPVASPAPVTPAAPAVAPVSVAPPVPMAAAPVASPVPVASPAPRQAVESVSVCPFLGFRDDPSTRYEFPDAANLCHAASERGSAPPASSRRFGIGKASTVRSQPIDLEHQKTRCLSAMHEQCSRYPAVKASGTSH